MASKDVPGYIEPNPHGKRQFITVVTHIEVAPGTNTENFIGQMNFTMAERAGRRFMVDLLTEHLCPKRDSDEHYEILGHDASWYDGLRHVSAVSRADAATLVQTSKGIPNPFELYRDEADDERKESA